MTHTISQSIIDDIANERDLQIRVKGYSPEHDVRMGTQHFVDVSREQFQNGCGYYHRRDLVKAAAVLVAALEAWDERTSNIDEFNAPHDERACEATGERSKK